MLTVMATANEIQSFKKVANFIIFCLDLLVQHFNILYCNLIGKFMLLISFVIKINYDSKA